MSLGEQSLDQLVDVVLRLLKWIILINPVKHDIARPLVPQLQGHLRFIDVAALLLVGTPSEEEKCLVALPDETIWLPADGGSRISVSILLDSYK